MKNRPYFDAMPLRKSPLGVSAEAGTMKNGIFGWPCLGHSRLALRPARPTPRAGPFPTFPLPFSLAFWLRQVPAIPLHLLCVAVCFFSHRLEESSQG